MTDTKAALDELNAMRMRLKAIDGTYDWEDSYKAIEAALQSPAVPGELVTALEDANQMCRSMYQIAARGGKDTNWPAFTSRLERELDRQHKALALLGGKEG